MHMLYTFVIMFPHCGPLVQQAMAVYQQKVHESSHCSVHVSECLRWSIYEHLG